jgi:hypothetical protein
MKKYLSLILLSSLFLSTLVFAQTNTSNEIDKIIIEEDGRYVMRIMNGRAIRNTRIPAVVLDQIRGIVWTCQNLQDGRPLWVKADLGQNESKILTRKKYKIKMLEWQDADFRMPAIVLDIDEGITWTCQNIIDGKAMWIQTDLKNGIEKEVSRTQIGILKK